MQTDIHPTLHPVIFRDDSAGASFTIWSTMTSEEVEKIDGVDHYVVRLDISSASHPFYTGKQKLIDTSGRVEKFKRMQEKAAALGGGMEATAPSAEQKAPSKKVEEKAGEQEIVIEEESGQEGEVIEEQVEEKAEDVVEAPEAAEEEAEADTPEEVAETAAEAVEEEVKTEDTAEAPATEEEKS